jgi:hypothetical protein
MKLGLHLGYSGAELRVPVELVRRAEALGYDSVWTAEAYGSDAVTPLAFLAGKTVRINYRRRSALELGNIPTLPVSLRWYASYCTSDGPSRSGGPLQYRYRLNGTAL